MWKVLAAVGGVTNGLVSGTETAGLAMPRFLDVGGASVLQPGDATPSSPATFTLAAYIGAMLVGLSGGRGMTAEADKQLNHTAAVTVAQAAAQAEACGQLVAAGPKAAGPFTALSKIVQDATPVMAVEESVRGQMGGGDPP